MDARDLQLSLIQQLLEAPGNLDGWQAFLTSLCRAVDGVCGELISHEFQDDAHAGSSVAVSAFLDETARQTYQQYWGRQDPWAAAARTMGASSGDVLSGDALISRSDMRCTAFFNDYGLKWEITQCLVGLTEVSSRRISCVSVNRSEPHERFGRTEGDLFVSLVPHVQRALVLHRRLEGADAMASDLATAVDHLAHGVVLLTNQGKVVFANRVAALILRRRDGLFVDNGELLTVLPGSTSELRVAVKAAMDIASGERADGLPTTVRIPRAVGRPPYTALVAPLPRKRAGLEPRPPAVAVFVSDPDRRPAVGASSIRALFGLTKAEADLAVHLCEGLSLEHAAAALGVRVLTARTRVKVVFQKTGTHRQADLIRLLLTSVAPIGS